MSEAGPAAKTQVAEVSGWVPFGLALAFWFALMLDPFGIDSASSARSEDVAMRLASSFYTGSGDVTVVLIDDDYLERTRSSWPMPYAQQGLLLHRLLQYEPHSVFLDILYRRPHLGRADPKQAFDPDADNPQDLTAAIEHDTDKASIYLPVLVNPAWTHRSDIELCPESYKTQGRSGFDGGAELAELLRRRNPDGTAVSPQTNVATLFGEHRSSQVVQLGWFGCGDRYPLFLGSNPQARTPAFAMFMNYCASEDGQKNKACEDVPTPKSADGKTDDEAGYSEFLSPMLVRWGSHPPSAQIPFYRHGVCQEAAEPVGQESDPDKQKDHVPFPRQVKVAAQELLLGILSDLRREDRPELSRPCPAINVISASSLTGDRDATLNRVLAGKHVLVGTKIEGVLDTYISPVHGQVPGVMVHAMALDNLINDGASYARDVSDNPKRILSALVLIALVLASRRLYTRQSSPKVTRVLSWLGLGVWALIAIVASAFGLKWWPVACLVIGLALDSMHPRDTAMHTLLIVLLAVLAPLCLEMGMAPLNWIGLFLVAFAFAAAVKPLYKVNVRHFPHPDSLLGRVQQRLKR